MKNFFLWLSTLMSQASVVRISKFVAAKVLDFANIFKYASMSNLKFALVLQNGVTYVFLQSLSTHQVGTTLSNKNVFGHLWTCYWRFRTLHFMFVP